MSPPGRGDARLAIISPAGILIARPRDGSPASCVIATASCSHSRGCRFPYRPRRGTERRRSASARVSGCPNAPALVTPEACRRVEMAHAGVSEGLGRWLARRYARRPGGGRGGASTSRRLQHRHGEHAPGQTCGARRGRASMGNRGSSRKTLRSLRWRRRGPERRRAPQDSRPLDKLRAARKLLVIDARRPALFSAHDAFLRKRTGSGDKAALRGGRPS
jgi:hypothetical protein